MEEWTVNSLQTFLVETMAFPRNLNQIKLTIDGQVELIVSRLLQKKKTLQTPEHVKNGTSQHLLSIGDVDLMELHLDIQVRDISD